MPFDRDAIVAVGDHVVGRERETELLIAALDAGGHVLLEGPPGTGKSMILRSVAAATGASFTFVEGNADLSPSRLSGHFDPAGVLADGYRPDVFIDGPLIEALRDGGLLYVEEINRVPEETLNLLITVMSEGDLTVPRLGRVEAAAGFRLVAAMNPFDPVGTARIAAAIYDRMNRISMGYQDADAEAAITTRASGVEARDPDWIAKVVELVRRTRSHPEVRVGSSVRGTIDMVRVAVSLGSLRGASPESWTSGLDAALVALSGRLRLHDSAFQTPEAIVAELYEEIFGEDPEDTGSELEAPDDGSTPPPEEGPAGKV